MYVIQMFLSRSCEIWRSAHYVVRHIRKYKKMHGMNNINHKHLGTITVYIPKLYIYDKSYLTIQD